MRFVFDKEAYSESFGKYPSEERELIRKMATEFEGMVGDIAYKCCLTCRWREVQSKEQIVRCNTCMFDILGLGHLPLWEPKEGGEQVGEEQHNG